MSAECCDDIETYIDNNMKDYTFKELLFIYIDDRDLKDSDVYNKVHIDRRLLKKMLEIINPIKEILFYLVYHLNYRLMNY